VLERDLGVTDFERDPSSFLGVGTYELTDEDALDSELTVAGGVGCSTIT
jgi:hypothetical protein